MLIDVKRALQTEGFRVSRAVTCRLQQRSAQLLPVCGRRY